VVRRQGVSGAACSLDYGLKSSKDDTPAKFEFEKHLFEKHKTTKNADQDRKL